ncbi:hypothetical protein HDV05_002112 [Chytridiales sp. JEL 0842]|nr:hypothetical protein HDV05_002112 [Chytridiales sp. JEL 0842]
MLTHHPERDEDIQMADSEMMDNRNHNQRKRSMAMTATRTTKAAPTGKENMHAHPAQGSFSHMPNKSVHDANNDNNRRRSFPSTTTSTTTNSSTAHHKAPSNTQASSSTFTDKNVPSNHDPASTANANSSQLATSAPQPPSVFNLPQTLQTLQTTMEESIRQYIHSWDIPNELNLSQTFKEAQRKACFHRGRVFESIVNDFLETIPRLKEDLQRESKETRYDNHPPSKKPYTRLSQIIPLFIQATSNAHFLLSSSNETFSMHEEWYNLLLDLQTQAAIELVATSTSEEADVNSILAQTFSLSLADDPMLKFLKPNKHGALYEWKRNKRKLSFKQGRGVKELRREYVYGMLNVELMGFVSSLYFYHDQV